MEEMVEETLKRPPVRRRVLGGLLDADGWTWAGIKAFFWLVVLILMLGYLPDRAYYFTVFSTIDLGFDPSKPPASYVTPINLCPPENDGLPCPPPTGAALPWQVSPPQLALPAPRTDGALVQVGTRLLYIGGTDGQRPSSDVYVSSIVGQGNFSPWEAGPPLPEPRVDPAVVFFGGSVYVIGGSNASGAPTTTTFVLTPDPTTGALGSWQRASDANLPLDLPAPRTGAAAVAAADGIFLVGGADAQGPTASVWKSTLKGTTLGPWTPQAQLVQPRVNASAAIVGNFLWVYGGADAAGPSRFVQVGFIPASGDQAGQVVQFGVQAESSPINLPAPRTKAAGFTANGALYLVGGADAQGPKSELYWLIPDPTTAATTGWQHLPQSDLPPGGLAGAGVATTGANAFLVGGTTTGGVVTSAERTNLAPKPPFFQVSLLGGLTVPALKIGGEIGQQLGYLNAAAVFTVDFAILVYIGYLFNHPDKARALRDRLFGRRRHGG
jgi:hypothetical protein